MSDELAKAMDMMMAKIKDLQERVVVLEEQRAGDNDKRKQGKTEYTVDVDAAGAVDTGTDWKAECRKMVDERNELLNERQQILAENTWLKAKLNQIEKALGMKESDPRQTALFHKPGKETEPGIYLCSVCGQHCDKMGNPGPCKGQQPKSKAK